MRLSLAVISVFFVAVANAHFLLDFPLPRGLFVDDQETNFCGGYANATTNRTAYPLAGGYFSIFSAHPQWTLGVFLATDAANTFDDFKQIKPFFTQSGEGDFCFPLNFTSPNATGLTNGENVTIQVVFDGGDGTLYQCADLTLSNTVQLSNGSTSPCSNQTNTTTGSTGNSAAGLAVGTEFVTVALGLAGLAAALSF
ncbi:hypothetical protein JOM56_005855 [Amanita muscaria]